MGFATALAMLWRSFIAVLWLNFLTKIHPVFPHEMSLPPPHTEAYDVADLLDASVANAPTCHLHFSFSVSVILSISVSFHSFILFSSKLCKSPTIESSSKPGVQRRRVYGDEMRASHSRTVNTEYQAYSISCFCEAPCTAVTQSGRVLTKISPWGDIRLTASTSFKIPAFTNKVPGITSPARYNVTPQFEQK